MGSTYKVGLKSASLYDGGFEAAAKYINASISEIGSYSFSYFLNFQLMD